MSKASKYGCDLSPTVNCIGWHSLTEEEYKNKLELYNENKNKKNLNLR